MEFVLHPTAPQGHSQIQMDSCLRSALPSAAPQTPSHPRSLESHTVFGTLRINGLGLLLCSQANWAPEKQSDLHTVGIQYRSGISK